MEHINTRGNKALALPMSLANHLSIEQTLELMVSLLGSIDVLVNNAFHWGMVREGVKL